jgi:hypothetical protein
LRPAYELLERELLRLRVALERFGPLRFDDEDGDRFRAGDFLGMLFLAEVLLLEDFFVEDLFAGDFFLDGDFVDDFLVEDLFAGDFFLDGDFTDDLLAFCLRCRTSAAPPITVPSAAALVAATNGFWATAPTAFFAPEPTVFASEPTVFAPEPTADAASPAFSFTVDIVDPPICSISCIEEDDLRVGGLRPPAFATLSLTVWNTSRALSFATSCIASAIVPTMSCAASVASTFLPACVTDSVSFLRSGMGFGPSEDEPAEDVSARCITGRTNAP